MDTQVVMAELRAIRTQLNAVVARQQFYSETLRKSANSINVIIRLLAVSNIIDFLL